jgi:hypothetical protein
MTGYFYYLKVYFVSIFKTLFEVAHDQYLVESLPENFETDVKSVRTYASEVRKTIENADILIEVFT